MKTQSLLDNLASKIQQLETDIRSLTIIKASQHRFDNQLFTHRQSNFKYHLSDYLTEIKHNFALLTHSVNQQHHQQVTYLAERLVAQIAALKREMVTQSLRAQPRPKQRATKDIYQVMAQHLDYERRLCAMVYDRESLLPAASQLTEQQKIQKEIVVLEGRLQRCRQAIKKLEDQLE